ncbi:MAG: NfeD family protein, partial [Alphaproteobacteria bacterium]|nr:NfeD family protein [Alphaproteobacteria bacterium]
GIFTDSYNILIPLFVVLSILFLLFLRPLFNINSPKTEDSLDSQYRGKQATAITNINTLSGRIKIYDEDWEARLADENSDEIKKGQKVRIVNHDNLTMYVETTAKKGKK